MVFQYLLKFVEQMSEPYSKHITWPFHCRGAGGSIGSPGASDRPGARCSGNSDWSVPDRACSCCSLKLGQEHSSSGELAESLQSEKDWSQVSTCKCRCN